MKYLTFVLVIIPILSIGQEVDTADINQDLEERYGLIYKRGSSTPFSGVAISYYSNSQVERIRTLKDGKKEGPWTDWYRNGNKEAEGNFKNGEVEGLVISWHINGNKDVELNIENGKAEGRSIGWHENGTKRFEANFKKGSREGFWTEWHENGQKKEEGYFELGKRKGLWTSWYESGSKRSEETYMNGKRDFPTIFWFENGQKKMHFNQEILIIEFTRNISKRKLRKVREVLGNYQHTFTSNHPTDRLDQIMVSYSGDTVRTNTFFADHNFNRVYEMELEEGTFPQAAQSNLVMINQSTGIWLTGGIGHGSSVQKVINIHDESSTYKATISGQILDSYFGSRWGYDVPPLVIRQIDDLTQMRFLSIKIDDQDLNQLTSDIKKNFDSILGKDRYNIFYLKDILDDL